MNHSSLYKNLPKLIRKVKALEIKNANDLLQLSDLITLLLDVWRKVKEAYRKKLAANGIFNEWLHAEYEAEEEIIIGLLVLVNEKVTNFSLINL